MLFPLTLPAKPFLKWAGGKSKLLPVIRQHLPPGLSAGHYTRYVEPFLGGGALFFYLAQQHFFEELIIGDANEDLCLTYQAIRDAPAQVLGALEKLQNQYNALPPAEQAAYYQQVREVFNADRVGWRYGPLTSTGPSRAAQLIFLNKTCFNGLYRMNSRAEFNVPWGKYRAVRLCEPEVIYAAAGLLSRTQIVGGDFAATASTADARTFVYLDPPYRPLSPTANFTSYARLAFGEAEQLRLAAFVRQLDARGSAVMLSNSDPFSATGDLFFEQLYAGHARHRVTARRAINANGARRGAVSELLIINY